MTPSDTMASVWRAAKNFCSGTLISRVTGMLRDVAMAYSFGSHPSVAAFMMAFRFSHLFRRLLGEGALQSAVVPHFEVLRGDHRAGSFFRDLFLSLLVILVATVGLGEVGLGSVLLWGGLSSENQEIVQLTALMLPSLLFICLFGLNLALLQCEHRYFLAGFAPAVFNLVWTAATVWLMHYEESVAMKRLGVAIVFACAANWLITMPTARNLLRKLGIRSWFAGGQAFSPEVRRLWAPLTLGIVGVSATQLNSAFDVIFARCADPSGPAYLWYAIRLQQLPLGLFGIALSGALLPPLSRAVKEGDKAKFRKLLAFALDRSFALMLPCTLFLGVGGLSVIGLLYGHGDFGVEATFLTMLCLWGYALGLIPAAWVLIIAPAYYAQKNYKTPTKFAVLAVAVNLLSNSVLVFGLGGGAWGVALATSLSSFANWGLLTWALEKEYRVSVWTWSLARSAIASLSAATLTWVVGVYLFPRQMAGAELLERDLLQQLLGCVTLMLAFSVTFFSVDALLGGSQKWKVSATHC